jgi:hypothetical protein
MNTLYFPAYANIRVMNRSLRVIAAVNPVELQLKANYSNVAVNPVEL